MHLRSKMFKSKMLKKRGSRRCRRKVLARLVPSSQFPPSKKPSCGGRRVLKTVLRLSPDDVCRLKAFGALQQIKLHGLTFIERAVAVLLDGGEVHEYIFSRG